MWLQDTASGTKLGLNSNLRQFLTKILTVCGEWDGRITHTLYQSSNAHGHVVNVVKIDFSNMKRKKKTF
jgi:hypothetical protein